MAERTARNPRGAGRKPLDKNHKTIGVTIRFSEDIYNKIETKSYAYTSGFKKQLI